MLRKLNISMVIAALSLVGCVGGGGGGGGGTGDGTGTGDGSQTPTGSLGLPGATGGEPGSTVDHDDSANTDPFEVLQRMQLEGPPEISTRMHSCQKMKYATVGNVLKQLGVNL